MATIRANTAEGGSNTTAVTAGNSGGSSGTAWDAISGGTGVWTFSSTVAARGSLSYQITQAASTAAALEWNFTTPLTTHYGRLYTYLTSFPGTSQILFKGLGPSFASAWRVDVTSTGQIRVRDSSNAILTTTTQTITTGVWWRIEWQVINTSGATCQIIINVYNDNAAAPSFSYTNSACTLNTQTIALQVGPSIASPQMPTMYFDEIDTDDSAFPGPAAPIANAGPDQNVTQFQTTTLDGSASIDNYGTISTYAWTQTSGTNVTLSSSSAVKPTFTAPVAPATLVFQLTVTDTANASGTDTVAITVGSGLLDYNTAEGGTNGTVATSANTGNNSGNAFNSILAPNSEWTFSNTVAVRGVLSYKCVQNLNTATELEWNIASLTEVYGRAYYYFTGFPTTSQALVKGLVSSFSSDSWRIDITSTGQVRTRDATDTIVATSTQTLSTGLFYRLEWHVISGNGTSGTFEVEVFPADSTTATYSYSNTACNTNVETSHVQFGPSINSGTMPTFYLDELALNPTGWIGVSPGTPVHAPPTANAGSNRSVLQGTLVQLDGSGSSDSDGTITSYAWTQTSGATVSLSNSSAVQPTFTAPAGPATLVFHLTVTDNVNATSSASVAITINTSLLLDNTAEGGTSGTVVTTANSGGSSGSAWNTVSGSGSEWTFSSTVAARGSLSYQCSQINISTVLDWDIAALTRIYGRAYYYFTGFPGNGQVLAKGLTNGYTSDCWRIDVTNTGQIRTRDATDVALSTSTVTMTPGVFYRLEWHIISGSGTSGTFELNAYTADQINPFYSYSNVACNTNTETSHVQFGPALASSVMPTVFIDELAVDPNGWIGSAPGTLLNSPPTANAGPDQNVSVNTSVSLNGSASSDVDGTIASYAWTQTAGTTVALSSSSVAQPTFTAPSSASTLTFKLTVTDNSGGIGIDTVNITVLADTILSNTAEGGSNSLAVTTANSGGVSGNAFTAVTGGTNAWTYSAAQAARGALSFEVNQVASSAAVLQWALSNLSEHYGEIYFYYSALATVEQPVVKGFTSGFSTSWRIDINAGGHMVVRDTTGSARYTGSVAVSPGIWYRLEWHVISSTTVGQIEARLYVGDQTTVFDTYLSGANLNMGAQVADMQFGPSLALNPAAPTNWYDQLTIGSAAGSWLGVAPGALIDQPPTANAGPDDTAEPNSIYTLQGSGVGDNPIASYVWTQISGPSVSLSNSSATPSFTTPAIQGGISVTFGLVVTDTYGLSSTQNTVTVTVLTPTLFFAKSGIWHV